MIHDINRRNFLKGTASTGLTLSFAGFASADGQTRYIARADDVGTADRVERAGFAIDHRLADGAVLVVTGPDNALADLEAVEGVDVAIPDFAVQLDEPAVNAGFEAEDDQPAYWDLQWDKHVTDVASAHDVATGAGSSIAIIDTGIDHTHPDLQNVNVDASASVFDGEFRPHTGDSSYHGTHVAGIAAATGAEGVIGTAPDAELISLRVFGDEEREHTGFWVDLLLAIEFAAAYGADAANMSIGTVETLPPQVNAGGIRGVMEPVMQHATSQGTVVVASAGNHGESLQEEGYFTLPNSLAGVLSVSATGPNDELTFYSNWGTNEIDVGAPGGGYETYEKTVDEEADVAWPYPTNLVLNALPGGGYGFLAGTSMAAPQVTGAAAVVRDVAPEAGARQVASAIKRGADLVDGNGDAELGAGRLNVRGALDSV